MKRSTALPLLLLLLLFLVTRQQDARAQSLLWRVSGNNLPQPSYIFGTIHAACPDDIHVSDSLLRLVQGSDRLLLELDLADERLRASMSMIAFMPEDTTLQDLLSEKDYERLSTWFRDSLDMSLARMDGIRPLFYVGVIMGRAMRCRMMSYEEVFINAMAETGGDVDGLETPAEQLDAFSRVPLRGQAEAALEMIDSLDAFRAQLLEIQRIYDTGDIEALYELVRNSLVEYGRYEDELLHYRNQRWVPRIERHLRDGRIFIAVGAGHLAGEQGVLALLRQRGYDVTPVLLPVSTPQ